MRAHLNAGDIVTISTTNPIIIKAWLVDTDGQNPATLTIVDATGDVTPAGGFVTEGDHGGVMQLNETCEPTVTAELQGTGSTATIYYELIEWKDILKLLRVFSY